MKLALGIIIWVIALTGVANAGVVLEKTKLVSAKPDKLIVDVELNKKAGKIRPEIVLTRNIIQLSMKDARVSVPQITKINDKVLKKIFSYQFSPKETRTRLILADNVDASSYKGKVTTKIIGNKIRIEVLKSAPRAVASANEKTGAQEKVNSNEDKVHQDSVKGDVSSKQMAAMSDDEKEILKEVVAAEKADRANEKDTNKSNEKNSDKNVAKTDGVAATLGTTQAGSLAVAAVATAAINGDSSGKITTDKKIESTENALVKAESDESYRQKNEASFMKMAFSLAVVLIIMGVVFFFFRKYTTTGKVPFANFLNGQIGSGKKVKYIEVVATHQLAPKKSISVIKVLDEFMVIGVSDDNIQLISKLGKNVDLKAKEDDFISFEKELVKKLREHAVDNGADFKTEIKAEPSFTNSNDFENYEEEKIVANSDVVSDFRKRIKSKVENLKPLG